jgi:hypothetical protein
MSIFYKSLQLLKCGAFAYHVGSDAAGGYQQEEQGGQHTSSVVDSNIVFEQGKPQCILTMSLKVCFIILCLFMYHALTYRS